MNGQAYRRALGTAAAALRAERGFRSVAALAKTTGFSSSTAYRVEGGKELERSLSMATIEGYAEAVGIQLGQLFTKADEIYARWEADGRLEQETPTTNVTELPARGRVAEPTKSAARNRSRKQRSDEV